MGLSGLEDSIPDGLRIYVGFEIELPAEFIGEAGSADEYPLAGNVSLSQVVKTEGVGHSTVHGSFQDFERIRPLNLADPNLRIEYIDIQPLRMGDEPRIKIAISLHVPKSILAEAHQDTVDDHAAVGIAGELIAAATNLHFRDVACENPIQQFLGVGTADLGGQLAGVPQNHLASHHPVHFFGTGGIYAHAGQSTIVNAIAWIVGKLLIYERMPGHSTLKLVRTRVPSRHRGDGELNVGLPVCHHTSTFPFMSLPS